MVPQISGGTSRGQGHRKLQRSMVSHDPEAMEMLRQSNRLTAFADPVKEVQELGDALSKGQQLPFTDLGCWCALVSMEVVLNLFALGFEADNKCVGASCSSADDYPWMAFDYFFTAAGVFEVVVAMVALGPRSYFCGDPFTSKSKGHFIRILDLVFVLCRVIDLACSSMGIQTGLKLMSMLRIVHLANLVKRLAPLRGFRELWLIVSGLAEAIRAVSFVVSLLMLIFWVFGTAMTILWGKKPPGSLHYPASSFTHSDFWGTVPKSMLTLFEVFTKDRWAQAITRPIVEEQWGMALFFAGFLVLTVLSLSTTLVGVVIESALSSAQANAESNGQEKQRYEALVMTSLEQLFQDADEDRNGDLTRQELHRALEKGPVRHRLKLVGISVGDLDLLFTLLDEEGSQLIKTSSFFRSCTRLRGDAMARHTSQYMTDLTRHTNRCETMETNVQTANNTLASVLDLLEVLDKDVIKSEFDMKDPVIQARRGRNCDLSMAAMLRHNPAPDLSDENLLGYKRRSMNARCGSKTSKGEPRKRAPWGSNVPGPPPIPPHLVVHEAAPEEEELGTT